MNEELSLELAIAEVHERVRKVEVWQREIDRRFADLLKHLSYTPDAEGRFVIPGSSFPVATPDPDTTEREERGE